jgi:hypothetical protein
MIAGQLIASHNAAMECSNSKSMKFWNFEDSRISKSLIQGWDAALALPSIWPRPNSRVTSRQIGFGPVLGPIQARETADFWQNTYFVKRDGRPVAALRAFAPKFATVSTGEMSKVPASIVSLLLEKRPVSVFPEMAAGDTIVGSRPITLGVSREGQ